MPDFHLIAGGNGFGKGTFARQTQNGLRPVDYSMPPIINPDKIARRLNRTNPDAAADAAARESLVARSNVSFTGNTFLIETTLSGKSELLLIRSASTRLSCLDDGLSLENVLRVQRLAIEERRTIPRGRRAAPL